MTWRGPGTAAPAYEGRHRRPRPIVVNEEAIPTLYLADVVRHLRGDATSLNPARIGPGFDIDDAMTHPGIDADDALTAWRTAS